MLVFIEKTRLTRLKVRSQYTTKNKAFQVVKNPHIFSLLVESQCGDVNHKGI